MIDNEMELILQAYAEEVAELLVEMETALLSLEEDPQDLEKINSVFRAMHTIKGTSGLFDFQAVVDFTHQVETVLDQIRNHERLIDPELISVLLACKDHTSALAQYVLAHHPELLSADLQQKSADLIARITAPPLLSSSATVASLPVEQPQPEVEKLSRASQDCWVISLDFKETAFRNGIDPLSFISYLSTLGSIAEVITGLSKSQTLQNLDPESCFLSFKIAFNGAVDKQTIENVFEFAADDCAIHILPPYSTQEHYLKLLENQADNQLKRLGEMLIEIGALTHKEVAAVLAEQHAQQESAAQPLGEMLLHKNIVLQPVVEGALKKQQAVKQQIARDARYLRVDAAKLDQLINLVGELVISDAAMRLMITNQQLSDPDDVTSRMGQLVEEIRNTALQLRMVQIGETFAKFQRVVRDVSKDLGKHIELQIHGGDTELDKAVVEKLADPLMHLVRNSLDHGLELPAERQQAGKPETGQLQLQAYHESGRIVIHVSDDGRGLDRDRILAKAVARGLVSAEQGLSDQEIYELIFAPGLSTLEEASNLSGRGVGMDVVRSNIQALRGSITVTSEPGHGTTVSIYLPLTLAIIDGFMVEARGERYIIPLNVVEECVEMDSSQWHINELQNYINLRGEVLPYLRLGNFFAPSRNYQTPDDHKRRESLVVVRMGQARAGFVVDELHGENQTVIKPLGKLFENLQGIGGATVLGCGQVALILDVNGLIQYAQKASVAHSVH